MADTRIFRITYGDGCVKYGNRRAVSNVAASTKKSPLWFQKADVIEATNGEATEGWTDVTDEFLGET